MNARLLFCLRLQVGRTETIQNNQDPQFARAFEVEYNFEDTQRVRFEVFDVDNKTPQLTDDDFLGVMETTLAEVNNMNTFVMYGSFFSRRRRKAKFIIHFKTFLLTSLCGAVNFVFRRKIVAVTEMHSKKCVNFSNVFHRRSSEEK